MNPKISSLFKSSLTYLLGFGGLLFAIWELRSLRAEISETKLVSEENRQRAEDAEVKVKDAETEITEKTAALEEAEAQQGIAEADAETARQEAEEATQQAAQARSETAKTQSDIKKLQADYERQLRELRTYYEGQIQGQSQAAVAKREAELREEYEGKLAALRAEHTRVIQGYENRLASAYDDSWASFVQGSKGQVCGYYHWDGREDQCAQEVSGVLQSLRQAYLGCMTSGGAAPYLHPVQTGVAAPYPSQRIYSRSGKDFYVVLCDPSLRDAGEAEAVAEP